MNPLFTALLDVIFPPRCHICRSFIPDAGALHLCPGCRDQMQVISAPLCTICGEPFPGQCDDHPCGACSTEKRHFDAARAALVYDGPTRNLIHAFKYRYKSYLRRPLGILTASLLTDYVLTRSPELIIPVPLHRKRIRSRGFNQAVLLGELLSRAWQVPLERRSLLRVRWTEPQINLPAGERRENVKGAFAVHNSSRVADRHILLLDDVFTTGSTVDECAKVLKQSGASKVTVVTVAKAISW